MNNRPHITYNILTIEQFPKFVSVYKQSFLEIQGYEPKKVYMENWMAFVIEKMIDPSFLFLCAQRGKKIVGIIIIAPMINFSGEKQGLIEPMFVIPEYRKYPFIATTMVELGKGWLKKKGYKTAFLFEDPKSDKWEKKKRITQFFVWKKLLKWEVQ